MIHIIGDSHGRVFHQLAETSNIRFSFPEEHVWCAHNLVKPERMRLSEVNLNEVQSRDHVILSFGEIDCRLHLLYQCMTQGRSLGELVDETVARYGQIMALLRGRGVDFAVLNIPPAPNFQSGNVFFSNPRYPRDDKTRINIYTVFHDALNAYCAANGFKIIDLWPAVLGPDGFATPEYKHEGELYGSHLGQHTVPLLEEELRRLWPSACTPTQYGE